MIQTQETDVLGRLNRFGWAVLNVDTAEELELIVQRLGPLIPSRTGSASVDLIPYDAASAPRRSMSAVVGLNEQPMHTDGAHCHRPPRYLGFFCIEAGEAVCPTNVWPVENDQLRREAPKLLTDPVWVFSDGISQPFYAPIMEHLTDSVRLRFDPCCMQPASGGRFTLSDAIHALNPLTRRVELEWQAGQAVIIDNWRCFHSRGAGSSNAPSRRLRRWWIGD